MKKHRLTPNGDLNIDEPLLSPRRILGAIWLWAYFDETGIWTDEMAGSMLWTFIVYHRRPYASSKKQFY